MKRATNSGPAVSPFRQPGLHLLRRIARAADALARRLPEARRSPDTDLQLWARAERRILGLRPPPAM